ncbi:MAG: hypothetical protein Q9195_006324 [Heterodermia aff. obscurata]
MAPPPPTPRPQSSSYPKFDPGNAVVDLTPGNQKHDDEANISSTDIPRRNSSDPSSSSSSSGEMKGSMQNLRGIFLSKEERERQGLSKKGEGAQKPAAGGGGAMKSGSVPGPLKSAMKPRSSIPMEERIGHSDLPTDREALTGKLNHNRSELQHLANRAEKINEWLDVDAIKITRLQADLKAAKQSLADSNVPSIHVTEAGSNNEYIDAVKSINDDLAELSNRREHMLRWRKEVERAVFWRREEFRRIEKAMGRKKSAQSGAVAPPTRNVGFDDQQKGKLGIAGGDDEVDNQKNRDYLAGLEAKLQQGMSLEEAAAEEQQPLREQDYARDRWTSSLSRLPTQSEWEDLFGAQALPKK